MAFAQLTYRESLHDIETCRRALGSRLYHWGIRAHVSRRALADANETRDYQTGDRSQTPAARTKPLLDGTNSQRHFVREDADFTGFFAYQAFNRFGLFVQPTRFIRIMTGQ